MPGRGLPPELPELPEISGTVDGAEFAEAVKQVQIAVSKDETLRC